MEGLPEAPLVSGSRVLIPGRVSKHSVVQFLSCEFCQVAKGLLKNEKPFAELGFASEVLRKPKKILETSYLKSI